jgi:RNA polymerase sigma-70 factor (ECF subfamily)
MYVLMEILSAWMRNGNEFLIQSDEDIRLMIRARNGDRSAYDRIYHRYFAIVTSFVARRQGHSEGCEDLAQEVFTRVWCRRTQYQPLGPVKNYLLGVAANVVRESQTRGHGPVCVDIEGLEGLVDASRVSPLSHAESAEQLQTMRELMARLSVRQRQALELVYLVGLEPREAARQLGCSVKALHVHLYKARRKLRQLARPSQ